MKHLVVVTMLGGLTAVAAAALGPVRAADKGPKDIVDTAVAAGKFKTLVTAVKAAGLVDTLNGDGPFTVFAPTDEAFAKVPKDVLDRLLKDKKALAPRPPYPRVPGKVMAVDVVKLSSVKTVQGKPLTIAAA